MKYDLCSPRPKKDGGTYWHKLGMMMPNEKGGFSIFLDSTPIADKEGRVYVAAFEQKPRDGQQGSQPYNAGSQQQAPAAGAGLDDDIPFAPEVR